MDSNIVIGLLIVAVLAFASVTLRTMYGELVGMRETVAEATLTQRLATKALEAHLKEHQR